MSRPPRVDYPGAWHHVMNRGARRQAIFRTDIDRRGFLSLLRQAHERYGIETHAFCLMGNHFHLLVRSADGKLSHAMRHIEGVHASRFNEHHSLDGPLYRSRFTSFLVDADEYLLAASRYIHLNPVEAGMVATAADYRWSSYAVYAGSLPRPPWLYTGTTLGAAGSRLSYLNYVNEGIDDHTRDLYTAGAHTGVLGSPSFARTNLPLTSPTPGPSKRLLEVIDIVANGLGVTSSSLLQSKRGARNVGRAVAVTLCRYELGVSAADLVSLFGYRSKSGVANATARLEKDLRADPALREIVDELRAVVRAA